MGFFIGIHMKKQLLIATGNPGKTEEFKKILGTEEFEFLTLKDIGFHEEIIEDGTTFEANALIKARAVSKHYSGYILADDSGLEVDALGGAPGIYTARYAGVGASDEENYNKLLKSLEGNPSRGAQFVCVIAIRTPLGKEATFRGEIKGEIQSHPRGDQGFGYDPIFAPITSEGTPLTYAQMSHEAKKADSHRGRAIELLSQSSILLEP